MTGKHRFLLAIVTGSMLVGGCTHLETRPTSEVTSVPSGAPSSDGAQLGLSYVLPLLQYEIKVRHQLESCPAGVDSLEFRQTIETVHRYVAGERFEVDYRALSSIMKTTNFSVTFHESGTLRSINASAQDHTGAVLADVARIGVSVASIAAGNLAGGVPLITGALNADTLAQLGDPHSQNPEYLTSLSPVIACTEETEQALRNRQAATNEVKRLTAEITQLTEEVTRYTVLATTQAALPEDRTRFRVKVDELLSAQSNLRSQQAELARLEASLSVQEEVRWPTEAGSLESTVGTIRLNSRNLGKLTALFEVRVGDMALPPSAENSSIVCAEGSSMALSDCIQQETDLRIVLQPTATQQSPNTTENDNGNAPQPDTTQIVNRNDERWGRGVFVREAAQARLVVCRISAQNSGDACTDEVIHTDNVVVAPQFGRLRLLPFTNGIFEEAEIKLTLRANGTIESFSYGEESAAANAASSLATASERIDQGLERIEEERRSDIRWERETRTYVRGEAAANRAEELAQLTDEATSLRRQQELAIAQARNDVAAVEAATVPLNAELAQLRARIAVLRATAELAAIPQR